MGLTLSDAVDRMRGEIDTEIKLTILREGADAPVEITLKRAVITIYPVRVRAEGDIGYLRVTTFNKQTSQDLKDKLAEVRDEIGVEDLKGYVLDLRNNPGGLLNQAIEVSDAFLEMARSSPPAAAMKAPPSGSTPWAATSPTASRSWC